MTFPRFKPGLWARHFSGQTDPSGRRCSWANSPVDRVAKYLFVISILLAAFVEVRLAVPAWRWLPLSATVGFVAMSVLSLLAPHAAAIAVLPLTYVVPATVLLLFGYFHPAFLSVWKATLLGLVLWGRGALDWNLPPRWKPVLVMWALVVAASWPIVSARELDFTWDLLTRTRPTSTGRGLWPAVVISGISGNVVTFGVGLLWFDWLFRTFKQGCRAFSRWVLMPLAASAVLAMLVGVYQGFVDFRLLSGGRWLVVRRAPGTMLDANAFGTVAALWGLGLIALAAMSAHRRWMVAGIAGLGLSWVAVWTSGSRTAMLVGVIGLGFGLYHGRSLLLSGTSRKGPPRREAWRVSAAAVAIVFTFLTVGGLGPSLAQTVNPIARTVQMLSGLSQPGGLERLVYALWDRDGYGTVATMMIREHPLVGVGVGSFNTVSLDYTAGLGRPSPADNAQNWYRHQLAELGILGSLGWVAWTIAFAAFLKSTRCLGSAVAAGAVVKGALVGIAVASLLGMPGQNAAVTLTFWTFVFWYLRLVDDVQPTPQPQRTPASREIWPWALIWLVVVVHAAGTVQAARAELRVPARAARFGWEYAYGFYGKEPYAYRWTQAHAVIVIPAKSHRMRLTFHVAHPDVTTNPVKIDIHVNGERIVSMQQRASTPVTRDLRLPDGVQHVLLETRVSRTWRPANYGEGDTRELGLAIRWDFSASNP